MMLLVIDSFQSECISIAESNVVASQKQAFFVLESETLMYS